MTPVTIPPFPHRWHTVELRGPFTDTDEDGEPVAFLKILLDGQEIETGVLWVESEDPEETIERAKFSVDQYTRSGPFDPSRLP